MRIDYDVLISCGAEFIDAEYYYMRNYNNVGYMSHSVNPNAYDAAQRRDHASSTLYLVSDLVGVPVDVIISAARVVNRYFVRNSTYIADAEKLVKALMD